MKTSRVVALALVVAACGLVAWLFLRDGPLGVLADIGVTEDTTVYSPGFSEISFRRVKVGMSQDEVRRLLGPPLKEYNFPKLGKTGFAYSESEADGSYRIRMVLFAQGKVTNLRAEYNVD